MARLARGGLIAQASRFESGDILPWGGGSVIEDEVMAADGICYAESIAIASRTILYQNFTAVEPSTTDTFTLSFKARTGSPALSTVSGRLDARRNDGSFLYADVVSSVTPVLTDAEWRLYSFTFQFDELWDSAQNMGVTIKFDNGSAGAKGLVDAVVLTQVPELSAGLVSCFGWLAIAIAWRSRPLAILRRMP